MTDDRKFATAKMDKPMNVKGEKVSLEVVPLGGNNINIINWKKRNFRKLLYIFLAPLLFIDWIVTLAANITELLSNSIKELALSLETYINHAGTKPSESET